MTRLKPYLFLFIPLALAWLAVVALSGDAPAYDLVVRGGKLVDGTGNPWRSGDLAVKGSRIVALGAVRPGAAKRTIDAKGLVVAPGFIDAHSHSDTTLLEDGLAQSKIRQGVTTEVLGEDTSPGPRLGKLAPGTITAGARSANTLTPSRRPASRPTSRRLSASATSGAASWANRTPGRTPSNWRR
jgi:N-acyl-D-amino-acid deacylase